MRRFTAPVELLGLWLLAVLYLLTRTPPPFPSDAFNVIAKLLFSPKEMFSLVDDLKNVGMEKSVDNGNGHGDKQSQARTARTKNSKNAASSAQKISSSSIDKSTKIKPLELLQ